MMRKNIHGKNYFKLLIILIIAAFLISTFLLITKQLLIVFPYSEGATKVSLNKSALQESLKLAGIDQLMIRPSIIVRISTDTPEPEKLIIFQRTAYSSENFYPSFGCNFNYSKFTKRIIYLNFYVKGDEYLERIAEKEEREEMLNQAVMMCLVDVISPEHRGNKAKKDSILKEFDSNGSQSKNVFEFKKINE